MAAKTIAAKRNLLLCFDAFGTLFTPSISIPVAYARAAARHGIECGNTEQPREVGNQFKIAFKEESKRNPNYGKATGLGAEKWWGNIIRNTFTPFLKPNQEVPSALITELLQRYSTSEGYSLYPDVLPFFKKLRATHDQSWPFGRTIVGIITNSDSRVPGILQSFGLNIGPRRIGTSDQRSRDSNLGDDISFVVLSYDVGVEKPERGIFDAAVGMLTDTLRGDEQGLKAESFEKLYVGDDLEKDYDGARAAGWNAVFLDRSAGLDVPASSKLEWTIIASKDGSGRKVRVANSIADLGRWRSGVS